MQYTGKIQAKDELYYYLAELKPQENETHLLFVQSHINRLMKKSNGDVRFAMLAKQLENTVKGK